MSRTRGFSLIELMIVVAILAIIAAIAYPSYGNYSYRARRADAKQVLQTVATSQERYYATYNTYTGEPKKLGYSSGTIMSENGYYKVSVSAPDGALTFEAKAEPLGPQANDKCGTFTLTNSGVKGFTGNESNGKCW